MREKVTCLRARLGGAGVRSSFVSRCHRLGLGLGLGLGHCRCHGLSLGRCHRLGRFSRSLLRSAFLQGLVLAGRAERDPGAGPSQLPALLANAGSSALPRDSAFVPALPKRAEFQVLGSWNSFDLRRFADGVGVGRALVRGRGGWLGLRGGCCVRVLGVCSVSDVDSRSVALTDSGGAVSGHR